MDWHVVPISKPEDVNIILGMSHFIKTVEDLHEALAQSFPGIRFGIAFCEASGPRLIRFSGSDDEMTELARKACRDVAAGHFFAVFLKEAFPINVMHAVRSVPEVVRLFCATANPVQVVVAESDLGRGVAAVIDGAPPLGEETEDQQLERHTFLRKIGYKL